MIKWFQKKDNSDENEITTETAIACLLIYVAKIDGEYSQLEKKMIGLCLKKFLVKEETYIHNLILKSEKIEENSVQIHHFTKKIKELDYEIRLKIIDMLLKIIYSDQELHEYEDNFIRRLAGLIYVEDKDIGSIKIALKQRLK